MYKLKILSGAQKDLIMLNRTANSSQILFSEKKSTYPSLTVYCQICSRVLNSMKMKPNPILNIPQVIKKLSDFENVVLISSRNCCVKELV